MKKTLFLVGAMFAGTAAFADEDSTVAFSFGETNNVESIQLDATDSVLSISNATIDVTTFKSPGVGGTYIAPDTNVQTAKSWTLTFDLTNSSDQEIVLTGINLSAFSFNATAASQTNPRTIDFTVSAGETVFSGGTATTVSNNFGITPVDTTGSFTLGAGGSVTISVTVDKNADINEGGCYVGLTGGTISYQVTPEPTTATLSLLALAGLCARRRRK